MEGYPGKLPADNYSFAGSAQTLASTTLPLPPPCPITTAPAYMPHPTNQTENETGTSLQEELREASNIGRKKKKKHKSGDDSNIKPTIMSEEELVDAAIPKLSESQGVGVEELVVPSTLPPPSGTLVGGQYLLNNTLLDHILSQKKMQILQSPEVIEYLKKQMNKK